MIGRTIAGAYVVDAKIGQGALASVYRARPAAESGPVALKILAPSMAKSPRLRERFLREARAAGRIRHEHVIHILDAGEAGDGVVFLVMELGPETTLATVIDGRPMPPREALEIAAQLAGALACAHELGVVHRDVKPANVLAARRGEAARVWSSKLVDFGLASIRGELGLTTTGELLGTPSYMAPEQVEGHRTTSAVDVYALGCVLFEMLTGKPPFVGTTPHVLDAHVSEPPPLPSTTGVAAPEWADLVVPALLAKDPTARPTAVDLARQLRDLLAGSGRAGVE